MTTALLPGSFDPPTHGHLDLIHRAAKLVDHLIVGIGENPNKKPLLSPETRIQLLNQELSDMDNLQIEAFIGLTTDFAKTKGARFLIRSLRPSHLEEESTFAQANRNLGLETLFLLPTAEYSHIHSSTVRELLKHGADLKAYVPKNIEIHLKKEN